MKRLLATFILISSLFVTVPFTVYAEEDPSSVREGFTYEHDPMENPSAAKDIVRNPDAVYGYSPNPESTRLGEYADALDWTDAEAVAKAREDRIAYHNSLDQIYTLIAKRTKEGRSTEEIAREASALRNQIRLDSNKDDPDGLAAVKKSNLDTYGNEDGPTPEFLFEKYGSWQKVLEKSTSPNPGMDACLGLYDEMYPTYEVMFETETPKTPAVTTGVEPAPAVYEVQPGDSLWLLGLKYYDDGMRWKDIYELNQSVIPNPSVIFPGTELQMPR